MFTVHSLCIPTNGPHLQDLFKHTLLSVHTNGSHLQDLFKHTLLSVHTNGPHLQDLFKHTILSVHTNGTHLQDLFKRTLVCSYKWASFTRPFQTHYCLFIQMDPIHKTCSNILLSVHTNEPHSQDLFKHKLLSVHINGPHSQDLFKHSIVCPYKWAH